MGKSLHLAAAIAALIVAAPAYAVGHVADTGKPAPKERHWDPYERRVPDRHPSEIENAAAFRKDCERHRKETCVKQLKPIRTEPLRDDLRAVTR